MTLRGQSAIIWGQTFTDDGNLDVVTDPASSQAKHEWLTDGRLKKIVLDSTATREFFYQDTNDSHAYVSDENSHLRKTLDKTSGGTTICSFAYELDAAGIRRSITDKEGKYRVFTYDPKYQLKSEMLWSAKVPGTRSDALLWTYDGNGNRLTQHDDGVLTDYAYGSNNEMTDAGSDEFTFDNFGNTASITGIETYSYDFESHMTQREASGGSTDTHEYDGDGRRMRSKLDDAADWTNFIHDELTENLISEYTLISGTFTIEALNTYGLGLISSNRQGTIRYFHFDGLGTTQYLTDSTQAVTDSYTYDAFGVPTSATGSSINPYRYVGQWGYYDDGAMGSTSEMLLLGVRYYWPKYGRFTVWDRPRRYDGYAYAANLSTMMVDSDGREPRGPSLPGGASALRLWRKFQQYKSAIGWLPFLGDCVADAVIEANFASNPVDGVYNICLACCGDAFGTVGAAIGSKGKNPVVAFACGVLGKILGGVLACPEICRALLGLGGASGGGISRPSDGCCCDCGYGNPINCSCGGSRAGCRIIRQAPCNSITAQIQQ